MRYILSYPEYLQTIHGSIATDVYDIDGPLSPQMVAGELRSRGLAIDADEVRSLEGDDITRDRIEHLAELLEALGRLSPEAAYYARCGLSLGQAHAALLHAHNAAIATYGAAALRVLTSRPCADYYICSISTYGDSTISYDLHPLVRQLIEEGR